MKIPSIGRRRAAQTAFAVAAALALLLWWLLPADGPSYPKDPVSFSTGVPGGVYAKYGELLQKDLRTDLPGVPVKLLESRGSVENVEKVATGGADFAIVAADAVADYHGAGWKRLRACARLYDDYIQLVVPADSSIDSASDLRDKRVGIGARGSGVNLIARRLLRAADLNASHDLKSVQIGITDAPQRLRKGTLDAFFWSGGLPTDAVQKLARHMPIKLVPLDDLADGLRRISGKQGQSLYRQAVMPADAYQDIRHAKAVKTIAVANLLVTTDRADAGLVERITGTVIGSRDRIGAQVHAAQLVDLRTAVFTDPLELHEGAVRYYRSVKP